jgi:hypothetical protein
MLHQAEGRDFAAQLRRLWDGRIGGPQRFDYDSKSARERRTADNLTSNMYTYHRVGYDQRSMEFLANGTIGRGAASREVYWNVAETDHAVILDILSWEEELTCRLKQCQNRVWTGRWLNFERMPVELAPARL